MRIAEAPPRNELPENRRAAFPVLAAVRREIRSLREHWTRIDSIILLIAAVLVGVVWAATIDRVRFEEADEERDAMQRAKSMAVSYADYTVSNLKLVEQTLQVLIREYQQRGRSTDVVPLLASGAISPGLFSFVAVVDERGDIISESLDVPKINVAARDWFQGHQRRRGRELVVSKPVMGRPTASWSIYMTRRIDTADGSFGGVAVAAVDPSYFSEFQQKSEAGQYGMTALLGREDGIARAITIGRTVSFGQDISRGNIFSELQNRDSGEFLGGGGMDGVVRYVSYRTLMPYPMVVAVGLSRDEVMAEVNTRKWTYYFAATVASALLALLAFALLVTLWRQKRANHDLSASRAVFRATFDQSAVGVSQLSLDGRFLRVNARACAILGYAQAELLSMTVEDVTLPAHRGEMDAFRKALLAGPSGFSPVKEKRNVRKDGTVIWVSMAIAVVTDAAGKPSYFLTMLQDVTAAKEAEERYRATFNQAGVGIGLSDRIGRFVEVNSKMGELLGYAADDLLNISVRDFVKPGDLAVALEDRRQLEAGEADYAVREFCIVRKDGSTVWLLRGISPIRDAAGRAAYFITIAQDITERKRAEEALRESQEKFEQLVLHIPEAFWLVDLGTDKLVYLSPAFDAIVGKPFPSLESARQGWREAIHEEDRTRVLAAFRDMETGSLSVRHRMIRADGSVRWVQALGFPVRDASGEAYRVAGTIEDVTDRHELEERLKFQAHHDPLTGLPNRVLSYDRLKQILNQARRKGWNVAVLFLDLDRFKVVNDTLGHMFGDLLLQQVSARLTQCVRAGDSVGRLGGDEFVVVLSELAHPKDAGLVAQKIIDELKRPFQLNGNEVFIGISVGIAAFPGDGEDGDTLLKNADAAMYGAKNAGKGTYRYYTAALNAPVLEKMVLESNLQRALERDEFVLHFQPKAALMDGTLTGCEVLLRWQSPDKGLIYPGEFVPVLEGSGLIVRAGEWVVRSACRQMKAWHEAGLAPLPIAVNLSAKQFEHQDICAMVEQALHDFDIQPSLLTLEVTESAAMHNPDEAIVTLGRLKALGVRLSIDDFGTGYSSLSYLKRFPVDYLKLDRSFVAGLPGDVDDAAIALAVITMAHSLGLKVVAEGVETEAQITFLEANGCDEMQGFLLARPMAAAEYAQWLARVRRLCEPKIASGDPLRVNRPWR